MNSRQLNLLEELINSNAEDLAIPHVKGNSVRIKHIVIRKSKKAGWLLYDTKENKQIAQMFCKTSALALAKTIAEKRNNYNNRIQTLDRVIQKHVNDCVFYKNTMEKTKNTQTWEALANRYEISIAISQSAKNDLERIILS